MHALVADPLDEGVHTYADLRGYLPDVTPTQRRKRVLAEGLPRRPARPSPSSGRADRHR
ncbi:hypothetical protein MAHJHV60_45920 [Mycobacterium avium subsp. hominissuis]